MKINMKKTDKETRELTQKKLLLISNHLEKVNELTNYKMNTEHITEIKYHLAKMMAKI